MQIVIDLPKETYKKFIDEWTGTTEILQAVRHGTPLPKGHGRIIDESKIRRIECHTERELYGDKIRYVKTTDAPTIIEGSDEE